MPKAMQPCGDLISGVGSRLRIGPLACSPVRCEELRLPDGPWQDGMGLRYWLGCWLETSSPQKMRAPSPNPKFPMSNPNPRDIKSSRAAVSLNAVVAPKPQFSQHPLLEPVISVKYVYPPSSRRIGGAASIV